MTFYKREKQKFPPVLILKQRPNNRTLQPVVNRLIKVKVQKMTNLSMLYQVHIAMRTKFKD